MIVLEISPKVQTEDSEPSATQNQQSSQQETEEENSAIVDENGENADNAQSNDTVSSLSKGASTTVQVSSVVGIGAATSVAILSGAPPTGIWAIFHQLQFAILLLMIDSYTPNDINDFLRNQEFALLNFNFIPYDKLPIFEIPMSWTNTPQTNEKLSMLGLESQSTFTNHFFILFAF